MQVLKKQLPPLEPLVAFEAAARHASFTLAARELSLSQAAVSQQIRNLEISLGVTLFIRAHRSIKLSAEGLAYRNSIAPALQQIASATHELKSPSINDRISVAADQSIASMWLIPRLPDFQRQHPSVKVRLVASDIEPDCLGDDIDLAIIHGDGNWPGMESELLFPEEVFAVCSPQFSQQHQDIRHPIDLVNNTLLNLESDHSNWMDWRTWLTRNDVHIPIKQQGLRINSYPLLIEAAKNGQGIALGWRYLVDPALQDGSLVKLFKTTVKTDFGYYQLRPNKRKPRDTADHFSNWAKAAIR